MIDHANLATPAFGVRREIDRIIGDAFSRESRDRRRVEWAPETRVRDDDDELVLTFELPGISLSDVEIAAKNNVLTVRGERHDSRTDHDESVRHPVVERRVQSFSRWFQLPAGIDDQMIDAHFDGEVLTVRVSKHGTPHLGPMYTTPQDAVMSAAETRVET
jgi:HSP20 family protein